MFIQTSNPQRVKKNINRRTVRRRVTVFAPFEGLQAFPIHPRARQLQRDSVRIPPKLPLICLPPSLSLYVRIIQQATHQQFARATYPANAPFSSRAAHITTFARAKLAPAFNTSTSSLAARLRRANSIE